VARLGRRTPTRGPTPAGPAGRDALVAGVLLGLALVVVGAAAYALAVAVSNGGIAGLVLGWTAAFAFAVSLPVLAMKAATAVYERVGG